MLLNEVEHRLSLPLAIAAKGVKQRGQQIERRLTALVFEHTGLIDLARSDELGRKTHNLRNLVLSLLEQRPKSSRELCRRLRHDARLFTRERAGPAM